MKRSAFALLAASSISAGPVAAQTLSAASSPSSPSRALPEGQASAAPVVAPTADPAQGDIVVTANKRSESVSRTPIAVTALTGATLKTEGVVGLRDLTSTTPGLQIKTASFVGSVQVTIRGITNTDFNSSGNPAIATYIDGMYIARTQGLSGDLLDVSRVEVLRGPQGTLYGRNATGGNVNVITNDPVHEFGGSAEVSYGRFNDLRTEVVLNVPVTDSLAVRFAGAFHRNDGLFNNSSSVSDRYGRADDRNGRIVALWTPSSRFSWRVAVDGSEQNGTPGALFDTGPDGQPIDHRNPYYHPVITETISPDQHLSNLLLRSTMSFSFDPFTLSYVAGYQHLDVKFDFTNAGSLTPALDGDRHGSSDSTYHEVNLSYKDSRLQNVAGATYFHQTEFANEAYDIFDLNLGFASGNPTGPFLHGSAWGVFDQATFSATSKLQVIAGLRYSSERRQLPLNGTRQAFCPGGTPLPVLLQPVPMGCAIAPSDPATGRFSDVTYRAGLQYDFSATTTAYATATSGFKAGGVNEIVGVGNRTYRPEKNTNYEIGLKTRLLDNNLRLNLAGFYTPYKDLQVTQIKGVQQIIDNAAKAKIYGVEAEADWRLTSADRLSGFFSYLHATFESYPNAVDQQTGAVFPSLAGNRLINSPRFSGRVQYTHDFHFGNGGTLSPSAAIYAQSFVFLREFNLPVDRVNGYTRTDLLLTYASPSSKWTVQGFVYNLEDKIVRNGMINVTNHLYSDYQPPRLYGVRLSIKY